MDKWIIFLAGLSVRQKITNYTKKTIPWWFQRDNPVKGALNQFFYEYPNEWDGKVVTGFQ